MTRRRNTESVSFAEVWEDLRADYNMAKSTRFRRRRGGLPVVGGGADYHYRCEADYLRMLELARDFDRNDSIVGQTVQRAIDNILQDGFALDPDTGDSGLDAELKARWNEWAEDEDACDVAGERTFWDIEETCLRSAFVDGDICVLPNRDTGGLELVEAHRLRTPRNTKRNVVHGILLDERRRRLEYWFTKEDLDPHRALARVSDTKAYPVRDEDGHRQVFHIYTSKRASQTRGITVFAPIVDLLAGVEDLGFAKLIQAQTVSCFAIFRQRELGMQIPSGDPKKGAQTTDTLTDGSTRLIEGLHAGLEVKGAPGEKFVGFSPNVPNPEFFPHIKLLLTLIGINLGLPLVLVLLDSSETNFSGWRGAVDQARLGFRRCQRRVKGRLHRPVYRWKLRQWGADDSDLARRIANPDGSVDIFKHRWRTPRWPYIEPLKDASAALLRRRNAMTSARRQHGEEGEDYGEIRREIIEDNAAMIEDAHLKAEELKRKHKGLQVTWREIACLPTPDGVTITIPVSGEDDGGRRSGRSERQTEGAQR